MADLGSVFIFGTGSVGLGLAGALSDCGIKVQGIWSRSPQPSLRALQGSPHFVGWDSIGLKEALGASQLVILAVSDQAIAPVSSELAARNWLSSNSIVAHTSGCTEISVIELGSNQLRGGIHPLAAIPTAEQGRTRLRTCVYAIEGEANAVSVLRQLAEILGGRPFMLSPGQRPRYHAAAVMASNLMVGLMDMAVEEARLAGLEDPTAPLVELALGAIGAVGEMGTQAALTGPALRGDAQTLQAHLDSVEDESQGAYKLLTSRLLKLAERRGLDSDRIQELENLLE